MKNKKWILVSSFICLFIAVAGWIGWTQILSEKSAEPMISDRKSTVGKTQEEESKDFSNEVVNEPAAGDIVVFSTSEFENGHDFIAEFHDYYNDTLCWGRVNTVDYKDQKDTALRIVEVFKGVKVEDKRLSEDFVSIENTAKQVIESDDRDAMVKLHRLFHDLDIYFNGYSQDDIFGVTHFKGI
jgi:hypothetical protein